MMVAPVAGAHVDRCRFWRPCVTPAGGSLPPSPPPVSRPLPLPLPLSEAATTPLAALPLPLAAALPSGTDSLAGALPPASGDAPIGCAAATATAVVTAAAVPTAVPTAATTAAAVAGPPNGFSVLDRIPASRICQASDGKRDGIGITTNTTNNTHSCDSSTSTPHPSSTQPNQYNSHVVSRRARHSTASTTRPHLNTRAIYGKFRKSPHSEQGTSRSPCLSPAPPPQPLTPTGRTCACFTFTRFSNS